MIGGLAPVLLLLFFGIAAVMGSRALRLSPIVGYLVLGVVLSASGLGTQMDAGVVQELAELGVVFLLFDVGLHFSPRHVREQASDIFGFGPVQVAFGTFGLGGLALLCGLRPGPALLVGATLALSSTAVVARLVAERHQQNCPVGLTGTAILIFQDLAAILILIVATSAGQGQAVLPVIGLAVAKAAASFAVALGLARVAVRPLFELVARTHNEEVFTATALLVALATAWATSRVGLSLSLGAFLGGMVLAETPYRAIVQSEIKPFRGLLMGFFFISIGLSLDIRVLLHAWPEVLAATLVLVAAKAVLNMLASLMFRWSVPGSTQLGLLLAQGSEFAFVIFSLSGVRAMVGEHAVAVLIAAVALSLAATPGLAELGRTLAGQMRRRTVRVDVNPELVPGETPGPRVHRRHGPSRPRRRRRSGGAGHQLRGGGARPTAPGRGHRGRLRRCVRRPGRPEAVEHPGAGGASHQRAHRAVAGGVGGTDGRGEHPVPAPDAAGRGARRRGGCGVRGRRHEAGGRRRPDARAGIGGRCPGGTGRGARADRGLGRTPPGTVGGAAPHRPRCFRVVTAMLDHMAVSPEPLEAGSFVVCCASPPEPPKPA